MTTNRTEKTPVAELGGDRDEGLTSTPSKEQNGPMISHALTPAQYCKQKSTPTTTECPFWCDRAHGPAIFDNGTAYVEHARAIELNGIAVDIVQSVECHFDPDKLRVEISPAGVLLSPSFNPAETHSLSTVATFAELLARARDELAQIQAHTNN